MYQGKKAIDDSGQVPGNSRSKRGVIFDTADGRVHYSYSVASSRSAGFEPDVIDYRSYRISVEKSAWLALIMSKYLNARYDSAKH
jgi:predicted amidohydrolase